MERNGWLAANAWFAFVFTAAFGALAGCDSGDDDDPNGNGNELENGGKGGSAATAGSSAGGGAGSGASGSGAAGSNAAGSNAAGSNAAGAGGSSAGGGDLSKLKGSFLVKLTAAMAETPLGPASPALATLVGKLRDGDEPELVIWTVTDSEGDCELFEPSVPHCDPDCGGLAACVEGDVCKDYPKAQVVGDVRVSGLGAEFVMEPIANNYQPPNDVKLPYPPCAVGDTVRAEAGGGTFGAFALETKCIDVLDFPGPLAIEEGEPLALTWSPPTMAGITRVRVKMDISHHGGSKGKIECDVDDDGSYEIAASLVTKLVDLGVAGFPTVSVTRSAVGGPTGAQPEHVELTVSQAGEQLLDIPGLTSCTSDEHCEEGQTCRSDKTCG